MQVYRDTSTQVNRSPATYLILNGLTFIVMSS